MTTADSSALCDCGQVQLRACLGGFLPYVFLHTINLKQWISLSHTYTHTQPPPQLTFTSSKTHTHTHRQTVIGYTNVPKLTKNTHSHINTQTFPNSHKHTFTHRKSSLLHSRAMSGQLCHTHSDALTLDKWENNPRLGDKHNFVVQIFGRLHTPHRSIFTQEMS